MLTRNFSAKHFSLARAATSAGASLLAIIATAAHAQQTPDPELTEGPAASQRIGGGAEIIVTATRRASSVQDTPVAVAVTSGESIAQYNISDVQSLTRLEPSIVVNNQGVSANQFIIRGIVSDIGSTTGFYLDEAPVLGAAASESQGDGTPGIRLHDVERVEVLKGPQGTLFGSGSMAGTLRIITNKPKFDRFEGGFSTTLGKIEGGNGIYQADGFVNLPLTSAVAARAVVWGEWGGGYIDHRISTLDGSSSFIDEDANDRELWGGRFSVLMEPAADFSLLLQATAQVVEVDDVQYWTQGSGPYISDSPTRSLFRDEYQLYSATANYDTDFGTFTLIGSYGRQDTVFGSDSTQTGLALAESFNLEPFKTVLESVLTFEDWTAEARFASSFDGPLQIVVGGYYQHDEAQDRLSAIRANDVTGITACRTLVQCEQAGLRVAGFASPGVPASDFIYETVFKRAVSQWAGYAQADLEITDTVMATAGIRYYRATIKDFGLQVQDIAGPPDFAVPVPVPSWAANGGITDPYIIQDDRSTETSPSYNFSLMWEADPDLSFFARVASGFRVGGNNNAGQLANQAGITIPDSYGSDDLWSYELGAKAYLLGRDLFIDAAVYQMDWSNQQVTASDPTGAFVYTLNAGKTRIRGAEASINYQSDYGLDLGAGVTYTDAVLAADLSAEVISAGTIGFKGDRLPRVPEWVLAGRAGYETEIFDNATGYIQTDINYRSSSTNSFNDQNAFNTKLPAFALIGAQVGVRTGPLDISLYVENLTDKAAIYGVDPILDGIRIYSPNPRTFGLRVQGRF